ncbi:MAG: bifunctional 4-hydroxy-2-oxoglutarate aldolase/2-dehydro-3-deoxy-phosphogluconate aldolase [Sedimentisphaerales bacterium]|nr:bifunctional 4-hydroxy-2-oxoglutarate aldolase/2-dehydro-3-deoxy-phosphogluconate aldolase [Sedimentisphaerales bacterium]
MPDKQKVLAALKETGVVAVIRVDDPSDLIDVSKALYQGGVKFIEITMTVPGALSVIEKAVNALKKEEIYIGAGTVLDAETARLAILAGASYVVSPAFRSDMVNTCRRYGVAVMPGALTPTEVFNAWEGGADVVKVFPANHLGGSQYFKELKGPFPQIDIMPTGAVSRETAPQYIKAGACAFGVGGDLVGKPLIAAKDFATITKNAMDFIEIVKKARSK